MSDVRRESAGAGVWLAAVRPRTLPAAVVPVLVGLASASRTGTLDLPVAVMTLLTAMLIQIATNLANDYYDFRSGADTADRLGPVRVTQAGLVAPETVRAVTFAVLAAAAVCGAYLVAVGGWPIFAIGVASLICALAYTAGPWPLAYKGLGDVFVFAFFGVIAVAGTEWLQRHSVSAVAMWASVPVGLLATAILVVNNLRDIATDRVAGKRTLAVRLGDRATRFQYAVLLGTAFVCLVPVAVSAGLGGTLAVAAAPLAVVEIRRVYTRNGAELNASLAATARLHLVFGVLLASGLALG